MQRELLHIHIQGSQLSADELLVINKWRVKELQSSTIWGPDTLSAFGTSEIFLLKDSKTLETLAFARLRPVSIWIREKEILIWGIGAVISIERGRGFGRILMSDITKFLDGTKADSIRKCIIGFSDPVVSEFYRKLGFEILPVGATHFVYIDENNRRINTDTPDDVIFYPKQNYILSQLIADPKLEVTHYMPHW